MASVATDTVDTRSPASETIRAALRMAHSHDLSKRSVLLGLWQTTVSTLIEASTSRSDRCKALVRYAQATKGEGTNADSRMMAVDGPTAKRRIAEANEAAKLINACLDVFLDNLSREGRRDDFPDLIATAAFGILADIWGPRHLRRAISAQVAAIESGHDEPILPDEPVTTNTAAPAGASPQPAPQAAPPANRADGARPATLAADAPDTRPPLAADETPPPPDASDDDAPPPPMDEGETSFEDEGFAVHASYGDDSSIPPMDEDGEASLASLLALADEPAGHGAARDPEGATVTDGHAGREGHDMADERPGDDAENEATPDEATPDEGEVDVDDLLGLLDIPEPPPVPVLEDDGDDLPIPAARKPGEAFQPFMTAKEAADDAAGPTVDRDSREPAPPLAEPEEADPDGSDEPSPPPDAPEPPVGDEAEDHTRTPVPSALPALPDPSEAAPIRVDELPDPVPEPEPPALPGRAGTLGALAPAEPAESAAAPSATPDPAAPARSAAPVPSPEPPAVASTANGRDGVRARLAAAYAGRRLECCLLVRDDELGRDAVFAAVVTIRSADGLIGETREVSGRLDGLMGRRGILHACRETLARLGAPAPGERLRVTVDSDLILLGASSAGTRMGTPAEKAIWADIEALCEGRVVEWAKRRPGLGSGPGERCDRMIRATMAN